MPRAIFLVEDAAEDEELTRRALNKSGVPHRLLVARDGAEAVDCLLRAGDSGRSPSVDVVLLDLNLPKLSGLEVLKQLRANAQTSALPVVVLTSSTRYEDVSAAYQAGCNSVLTKAANLAEFEETIKLALQYWLLRNVNLRLKI